MKIKKIISEKDFYQSLEKVVVVSGGYFGDEAKGKIVESLLRRKETSFVVRTNSGANAGHTVVTQQGQKIVTHLVPSGIVNTKIKNIISYNCFLDPIGFQDEVKDLWSHKLDLHNLYIDNVFIVTPYHIAYDLSRGLTSTGRGMTYVAVDKVSKKSIKLEHLINSDKSAIQKNFSYWESQVDLSQNLNMAGYILPSWIKEFISVTSDKRVDWYLKHFSKYKQFYVDRFVSAKLIISKELAKNKSGIFEGAQSFYLSNDVNIHQSSSTASGTHALGTLSSLPFKTLHATTSISVIKMPSSRVGLGANPAGLVPQDWFDKNQWTIDNLKDLKLDIQYIYNLFLSNIDEKTGIYTDSKFNEKFSVSEALAIAQSIEFGEFGATTKRPRVTGFLDLPHLKYLVESQGREIVLSCVDRYVGFNKIPLVIGYRYLGKRLITATGVYKQGQIVDLSDQLPSENILKDCIPLYKVFDGYNYVEKDGSLHKDLQKILNFIETKTDSKIIALGTGPKSKDIIYLG